MNPKQERSVSATVSCVGESSSLTVALFLMSFARLPNRSVDSVSAVSCDDIDTQSTNVVRELPPNLREVVLVVSNNERRRSVRVRSLGDIRILQKSRQHAVAIRYVRLAVAQRADDIAQRRQRPIDVFRFIKHIASGACVLRIVRRLLAVVNAFRENQALHRFAPRIHCRRSRLKTSGQSVDCRFRRASVRR